MDVVEIESGNVIHASENDTFLTIFTLTCSSVGIALSAGALVLLFLTAILFAEWRQNYKNQLLIQFMAVRFLYSFVRYFYDIRNILNIYIHNETFVHFDIFCMIYTETALVFWMYVFTKQMYDSLVKVFVVENQNLWKASAFAWLTPGITSLLLSILFHLYPERPFTIYFIFIVIVKWPILIANAVLLILALKSVLKNNQGSVENNARIVVVMIILIFMFCFQQVFSDSYKIMYVIVLHRYSLSSHLLIASNILSLYHCAFSIIFWVFGNSSTRKMWKNAFTGLKNKHRPESLCIPK